MSIRVRGLLTVIGSGVGAGLVFLLLSFLAPESSGSISVPVVAAMPLAGVFLGAIELISGVPFTQVSTRWDGIPESVRAILSLVLIVVAMVVIFGGGILYLNWRATP